MYITGAQIALEGSGTATARQGNVYDFSARVQAAVGPKILDGRGLQGHVTVAYSIGDDGSLQGARVAASSGEHRLDLEALMIVRRASFPAPPSGMSVTHRTFVSAFTFR